MVWKIVTIRAPTINHGITKPKTSLLCLWEYSYGKVKEAQAFSIPCHKNIQENPGSLEPSHENLHMARDKIAHTGYDCSWPVSSSILRVKVNQHLECTFAFLSEVSSTLFFTFTEEGNVTFRLRDPDLSPVIYKD